MISGLEQIEENMKRGYRKAILGFVKSRVSGKTSYFIELTKGALAANIERIYMTKHDYIYAQELLDKYNELHRIEKEQDREKKKKNKEEKQKLKEDRIQELAENKAKEFLASEEEDDDECIEDEKIEDISFEEDPKSELILGAEQVESDQINEVNITEAELETENIKGDINEPDRS